MTTWYLLCWSMSLLINLNGAALCMAGPFGVLVNDRIQSKFLLLQMSSFVTVNESNNNRATVSGPLILSNILWLLYGRQ